MSLAMYRQYGCIFPGKHENYVGGVGCNKHLEEYFGFIHIVVTENTRTGYGSNCYAVLVMSRPLVVPFFQTPSQTVDTRAVQRFINQVEKAEKEKQELAMTFQTLLGYGMSQLLDRINDSQLTTNSWLNAQTSYLIITDEQTGAIQLTKDLCPFMRYIFQHFRPAFLFEDVPAPILNQENMVLADLFKLTNKCVLEANVGIKTVNGLYSGFEIGDDIRVYDKTKTNCMVDNLVIMAICCNPTESETIRLIKSNRRLGCS